MTAPDERVAERGSDRGGSARFVAVAVGVVLALFVVLLATREPSSDEVSGELVGRAAPAVEGTTIDGEHFDLDAQRGRWVVVNFFATWCVPCRVEHPELVEFERRHAEAGDAVVVSVAFDDEPEAIRSFFAAEGGEWPVLATDTGAIALDYGVRGVPESYLVTPSGQIGGAFFGVTADELDAAIASLEGRTAEAGDQ